MAVTILERPEGHILDTTAQTATVSESYGAGDAQFVSPIVHGLIDGDFIYAESDIENYAGFWYVDAITTGIFKIKQYSAGPYVQFIASGSITWYKSNIAHGWSAVHLPITYRLSTDLYPVNSSDTIRTVSSTQNANGWTVLLISGSLGSGVNSYDFLDLVAPNDTELSKPYQILEFISPTVLLINLEYDSTNNFTGATAQKRYNNYNIIVRVYAGINSSHQWTAQKPYELAATLLFIPDENNEAFFSINELLKSYIETRNNLTLGTLPNNIDFWTNFYIETAESYDDSDGYSFGTFTGPYTIDQDNFEGTAVNAKLAFKNQYSGYLSEYLMTNNTAKFLTLFTIPVLFACGDDTPNCYHEVSVLNPDTNAVLSLQKQYYINNVLQTTQTEALGTLDEGLLRIPVEVECAYDRVDYTIMNNPPDIDNFSEDYANYGSGVDWVNGVSLLSDSVGASSKFYSRLISFHAGVTYTISYNITVASSGSWDSSDFTASFSKLPTTLNPAQASDSDNFNTVGVKTGTLVLIPSITSKGYLRFNHAINILGTPASGTITINSLSMSFTAYGITETKQFDINCNCANQEIRLTWLNNLGGFDYWAFTAKKDHIIEIQEAMITKKNILPTWPKSYGAQADTVKKQTLRVSNKAYTVRSQLLTEAQVDAISFIESSVLVQIINSRTDRRTVIVGTESFVIRKDGDKTHEIAFNISFTDDIPVQTV